MAAWQTNGLPEARFDIHFIHAKIPRRDHMSSNERLSRAPLRFSSRGGRSRHLSPTASSLTTNLPPHNHNRSHEPNLTRNPDHGARIRQTSQNATSALRVPHMPSRPHLLAVPRRQPDVLVRAPNQHVQALSEGMGRVTDRSQRFHAAHPVPGVRSEDGEGGRRGGGYAKAIREVC